MHFLLGIVISAFWVPSYNAIAIVSTDDVRFLVGFAIYILILWFAPWLIPAPPVIVDRQQEVHSPAHQARDYEESARRVKHEAERGRQQMDATSDEYLRRVKNTIRR